mmetsp:Transcript_108175/g.316320  ORF Transcript_108175/g.316320 Transcript_108175/m.316320 type:complete len:108 (-) Transcript_108175:478-801(-)
MPANMRRLHEVPSCWSWQHCVGEQRHGTPRRKDTRSECRAKHTIALEIPEGPLRIPSTPLRGCRESGKTSFRRKPQPALGQEGHAPTRQLPGASQILVQTACRGSWQ